MHSNTSAYFAKVPQPNRSIFAWLLLTNTAPKSSSFFYLNLNFISLQRIHRPLLSLQNSVNDLRHKLSYSFSAASTNFIPLFLETEFSLIFRFFEFDFVLFAFSSAYSRTYRLLPQSVLQSDENEIRSSEIDGPTTKITFKIKIRMRRRRKSFTRVKASKKSYTVGRYMIILIFCSTSYNVIFIGC